MQTNLEKSKKIAYFGILGVVVIVLVVISIFSFQKENKNPPPALPQKLSNEEFLQKLSDEPRISIDKSCSCGYGINYDRDKGQVSISIIGGVAGHYATQNQLDAKYQEALSWIRSQGIDPGSLNIEVNK